MLKQRVFWGSITGFFFVSILGTINHFLYELSGNNSFVGIFTPVNESVWEHLKLLFFPFLIFCIGEFLLYGKNICGFMLSKFIGVLSGMLFIPIVFYIYSGIVGKSILTLDIIIFILAVFISYLVSYFLIDKKHRCKKYENFIGIILFLTFTVLFAIFTFAPPVISIFQVPA